MTLRRQEGQIIPGLVMTMAALVLVGLMFFQVGRAADFSTRAQTGADAAALAAAKDVKEQLERQVALTGTADIALVDPIEVRAKAEVYAARNHVHITNFQRVGADVRVWVATNADLGEPAKNLDSSGQRGEARSRAVLELMAVPGLGGGGGGGNIGPDVSGGDPTIPDKAWKKLKGEISDPPTCGNGTSTNDLVKLAHLLQAHGFQVGENYAVTGVMPPKGVHVEGSWHYRCGGSGALDVNHDQGDETGAIDGLVQHLHDLGFRTIWQAEGHFDHIHIDVANSGSIGAGFGSGGSVGALEDTFLQVKLLDWDAAANDFLGFGGASGVFFAGPPNMQIAGIICDVLDHFDAPPRVRLSAFEAAIVESGVHDLPYGDRDSLGVFQQRAGWGSVAQRMDPQYAATAYIRQAMAKNRDGESAGQLAQSVQISAYPDRYDAVGQQAALLMDKACG